MDSNLAYIENFKSLVRNAMFYAQKAHDFVFDDSCENYVAGLYLNIAAAKFSSKDIAESSEVLSFLAIKKANKADIKGWISVIIAFFAFLLELCGRFGLF